MADELDPVRQDFEANVEEYVAEVERAAEEGRKFARSAEEVKVATGGMRDKMAEAAAAIGITRDEMGKLRDKAGEVILATDAEARALKHLRDQALEAAWAERELGKYQKESLLSRLGGGIGGLPGAAFNAIPGGSVPMFLNPAVIAGAAAGLMAVVSEVGALATGFTAAGLGVGSFYILAHPALSNLQQDVQKLSSANAALGIAQQKYLIDPSKANLKALQNAQVTYHATFNQMGQDAGPAADAVMRLHDAYVQVSNAFAPVTYKVIGQLAGIATQMLPWIQTFANAAAPAIEQALSGISKFVESPNFQYFMTYLSQLSGPVIHAIGSGMEGLTIRVMSLLETFSKKDVINAFNIAFRLLGFTVELVQGLILEGMDAWDLLTAGLHNTAAWFDRVRHAAADFAHNVAAHFDEIRHDIATWDHDTANAFDHVRHTMADLAHNIAAHFDEIRHDLAHWVDDVRHDADLVIGFFRDLPGKIVHALGNLKNLLFNAGMDIINGLINGVKSMIGSLTSTFSWITSLIPSWKGPLEKDMQLLAPNGAAVIQGFMRGVASQVPALRSQLSGIGAAIPGTFGAAGGAYGGAGGRVSVSVPLQVAFGAWTGGLNSPQFLQYIQAAVQEATLRYGLANPTSGLALPGRIL